MESTDQICDGKHQEDGNQTNKTIAMNANKGATGTKRWKIVDTKCINTEAESGRL